MLVTEFGMDKVVRDVSEAKASVPILVTELGMDRVVSDVAPTNA